MAVLGPGIIVKIRYKSEECAPRIGAKMHYCSCFVDHPFVARHFYSNVELG
jgi:hypothetical protein